MVEVENTMEIVWYVVGNSMENSTEWKGYLPEPATIKNDIIT